MKVGSPCIRRFTRYGGNWWEVKSIPCSISVLRRRDLLSTVETGRELLGWQRKPSFFQRLLKLVNHMKRSPTTPYAYTKQQVEVDNATQAPGKLRMR